MQPRISVIVPVYKAEKYLHRCVNSVLDQTYDNFELILVDDGSPDNSGAICDEYAIKDRRIRVIHKKNGGSNSARRDGFVCCCGTFLVFLDSDDTLINNALELMHDNIVRGYDIVKCGVVKKNNKDEIISVEQYSFSVGEILKKEDVIRKIFMGDVAPYLCGAIYKRELFTADLFNKSIEANISFGEDWITNLLLSENVRKILCIKDVVYNYYINNESITNSQVVSLDYYNRQDKLLIQEGILDKPFLKNAVKARRLSIFIRSFFIPELGFSLENYKKIRKENYGEVYQLLKQKVDSKFLLFIRCLPLYYLYSRVYCLLFYIKKLHCKSRKVLR